MVIFGVYGHVSDNIQNNIYDSALETNIHSSEQRSLYERLKHARTWYWQLDGTVDLSKNVDVYDIDSRLVSEKDIVKLKKKGIIVVCYFSAGTVESWRIDKNQFSVDVIGKPLKEWPNEYWLNISVFNRFKEVMENRIKYLQQIGCDAVEADNIDGYDNDTGFKLSYKHSIDYVKWLASYTHSLGMLFGLKNAADIVEQVEPYVDFAIVEECQKYNECEAYTYLIQKGKPVFAVEYNVPNSKVTQVCTRFNQFGIVGGIACYELNGCFKPCK